jgi:hypothetical protein
MDVTPLLESGELPVDEANKWYVPIAKAGGILYISLM